MAQYDAELLIAEAEQFIAQGNVLSAVSKLRVALNSNPTHAYAGTRMADLLIGLDQYQEADVLLRMVLEYSPQFSPAHLLSARTAVQRGDLVSAVASLDRAILHDNAAWGARVEKAQILEQLGRPREASLCWGNAVRSMPSALRESPQMQGLVDHARKSVQNNLSSLRENLLDRLHDAMDGEKPKDLERFQHAIDILTGRREFVTAKPLFLPIPRLPAIPYFDRNDFPWAAGVESATDAIRHELKTVMNAAEGSFIPYVQTRQGESSGQFAPLDQSKAWSAYFLWKHGQKVDAHCAACPVTSETVMQAPLPRIRSRAPAVFFSRLDPGVHIPAHNGATNARLTVHLPLIVPAQCAFRVGDETREWKEGELLIFDDTILHEAWNGSSQQRVVLIFDIWHPMLTLLERELVTQTVETLVDYYDNASELGEL